MPTARLDLAALRELLSNLAENSPMVYWLSSPDFAQILYISPAYEKVWGRTRKELYNHPELWITYLHPDDSQAYHPIVAMKERVAKEGAKARYVENYRIVRPSGEVRWIVDRGFPVVDRDTGELIGVTGVAMDITEEKQLEEERAKAHAELIAAHEMKMRFIRDMQHDIRTPFTGLWGLAHALLQMETDPQKHEMIALIEAAAKQLLDYCNNILEFNKTESSPIMEEKLDLIKLMQNLITIEKPAAVNKKLSLSLVMDNVPQFIFGDYARLKSLLLNLVSNAIKFTDAGGIKLTVQSVKKLNDYKIILQFKVEDTGIGIPPEKQKFIYEKFSRVEPANRGKYTGSGLGLSIVKSIMHDLEGDIEVISEADKGTTFICNLPVRIPLV